MDFIGNLERNSFCSLCFVGVCVKVKFAEDKYVAPSVDLWLKVGWLVD